jgi:hypothetical protein
MAKEKKITIKYYLNTKYKKKNQLLIVDTETSFPVYTQVLYNRNNTRFYNPFTFTVHGLTKAQFIEIFENRNIEEYNQYIEEYSNDLEKIIRFEASILKDNFSIRGIGQRYLDYHSSLFQTIERSLINKLKSFVSSQEASKFNIEEKDAILHSMSDSLSIAYQMVKQNFPNVSEVLPKDISTGISAYHALNGMVHKNEIEDYLKNIDWLKSDIRGKFQNKVLNPTPYEQILENEASFSPAFGLFRDFPVNINLCASYILSIDRMLIERD